MKKMFFFVLIPVIASLAIVLGGCGVEEVSPPAPSLWTPPAPLSSAKAITAFSFTSPAATGVISGTSIAVTVPFGTDVTALIATFTASTGASVAVGGTTQISGTTANNFTSP